MISNEHHRSSDGQLDQYATNPAKLAAIEAYKARYQRLIEAVDTPNVFYAILEEEAKVQSRLYPDVYVDPASSARGVLRNLWYHVEDFEPELREKVRSRIIKMNPKNLSAV